MEQLLGYDCDPAAELAHREAVQVGRSWEGGILELYLPCRIWQSARVCPSMHSFIRHCWAGVLPGPTLPQAVLLAVEPFMRSMRMQTKLWGPEL